VSAKSKPTADGQWLAGLTTGASLVAALMAVAMLRWPVVAKIGIGIVAAAVLALAPSLARRLWLLARHPRDKKRGSAMLLSLRRTLAAWELVILAILLGTLMGMDCLSLVEAHVSTAIAQLDGQPRFGSFNSLPAIEAFYRQPGSNWLHTLFCLPYVIFFLVVWVAAPHLKSAILRGAVVAGCGIAACLTSQFLFVGLGVISTTLGLLVSLSAGVLIATERLRIVTDGLDRAKPDGAGFQVFQFRFDALSFFAAALIKGLVALSAVIATGFTILWGLKWGIVETKWLAIRVFVGVAGLLVLVGWGLGLPFWDGFRTLMKKAGAEPTKK
jgi:hypothetical protein